MKMELNDFDYNLPAGLIAQKAIFPKDHSRLMVADDKAIDNSGGYMANCPELSNKTIPKKSHTNHGIVYNKIEHKHFYDIIDYLNKGDVLVINETKVSKAKICGKRSTGSKAEITLTERIDEKRFKCRIKANKVRVKNIYEFEGGLNAELVSQKNDIFIVNFNRAITKRILSRLFVLPTPPYVKRAVTDKEYQTVYSKTNGSLASPTAGLHFTKELLERIKGKGIIIAKICLHIDFGTFLPVKCSIEEHKMHKEYFEIDKKTADIINNRKGRLIAVGTTSVRALESASDENGKILPKKGHTEIFIYPGYRFKAKIDALITNFHLPRSTLLMLVSAYYGREKILNLYKEAIEKKYRFYSLGDAMLLNSQPQ